MPRFHTTTIRGPDDTAVIAYALRKWAPESDRPVVLLLHGSMRNASVLAPWAERLDAEADVVLFDLPGHGRSDPIARASVTGLANQVFMALKAAFPRRRVLLVGESLGGTVALAIGSVAQSPVKAILAADPPITTAKLWSVAQAHRKAMARASPDAFVHRLAREVFGLTPDGVEERIYYPLIGRLQVPTVIATGDVPLLPPRRISGVTSLFDPVDQFVTRNLYPGKAEIALVPNCGHLVLCDAIDASRALIDRLLAAHVTVVAVPT